MNRDLLIQELKLKHAVQWDIIVIGGGATGLGVAVDSSSRGYKTLLLEQSDFAKGTSSRSTKLVHGGVRYLAQGDLALVIEALIERGRLLRNAPHLTINQEFIIPVYSWWDALVYTIGLKFYDILAGKLSLGRSYFIKRSEVYKRLPHIKTNGLKGGVLYHDGQFDDARMAIDLAQTCIAKGGITLNYFRVDALSKDANGKVNGVFAIDLETHEKYHLLAKAVVNATGVFADEILKMDDLNAKSTIRPSQGIHLVVDRSFLDSQSAIMIPSTDDGRVLFAIPWYGKVVLGTTDTPVDDISLEPLALKEEIDFILQTAGRYLDKSPTVEDVLCVYAGLRPLAADPDNPSSTKEISRRHKIKISASGLVTIEGGKWTIYRRMAQDTVDKIIKIAHLPAKQCITYNLQVYGFSLPDKKNRMYIYGVDAIEIEKMIHDQPGLGNAIHPRMPYTLAEAIWIIRNEMPRTIEDFLARRIRALFLDARAAMEAAPVVASLMAKELNHDSGWVESQVKSFNLLASNYLIAKS